MQSLISKIVLSLSLTLLLSACGGGGGGSDSGSGSGSGNSGSNSGNQNNQTNNTGNQTNTTTPPSNEGNLSMPDDYILPPIPNERENDKTLHGVDSNNNNVRDDIEIYIYERFHPNSDKNYKVHREIAMQWARAAKELITNPETAYEDGKDKFTDRVLSCKYYYIYIYSEKNNIKGYANKADYMKKINILDDTLDDVIFNTKQRLKAYFRYNESMSGHVFDDYPNVKESCDFDIDSLIVYQ